MSQGPRPTATSIPAIRHPAATMRPDRKKLVVELWISADPLDVPGVDHKRLRELFTQDCMTEFPNLAKCRVSFNAARGGNLADVEFAGAPADQKPDEDEQNRAALFVFEIFKAAYFRLRGGKKA
jgi:hypothetical protein